MKTINNMKKIREIYGATQDEISKVAGVNRSTVSQWETGALKASNTKLEKLSLFYRIGPEYFYESELTNDAKEIIVNVTSSNEEAVQPLEEKLSKADVLAKILEETTFTDACTKFMVAMKLLLATADSGELGELKSAYLIAEKMALRLKAIIELRDKEETEKEKNNDETLFDLLNTFA